MLTFLEKWSLFSEYSFAARVGIHSFVSTDKFTKFYLLSDKDILVTDPHFIFVTNFLITFLSLN